jgi:hypothetical protein
MSPSLTLKKLSEQAPWRELQLRMMWGNVGYSVLAWFCIWACLMFGTRRPLAALVSLTMGIPIIVFAVFFDQESHLPVLRRIRFTLGVGCFCTTERGDVFSICCTTQIFSPSVSRLYHDGVWPLLQASRARLCQLNGDHTANTMFSVVSGLLSCRPWAPSSPLKVSSR